MFCFHSTLWLQTLMVKRSSEPAFSFYCFGHILDSFFLCCISLGNKPLNSKGNVERMVEEGKSIWKNPEAEFPDALASAFSSQDLFLLFLVICMCVCVSMCKHHVQQKADPNESRRKSGPTQLSSWYCSNFESLTAGSLF